MGVTNSNATLARVKQRAADHGEPLDFVLHLGDISYADDISWLGTNPKYEQVLDHFINTMIEPIASAFPYHVLPGNHDAVRPAEPQPALDPEVQQDYSDAVFVGNPCDFSLHGVRILSYHGKSIDDFVAGLRSVTYSSPELAMRAMMERRHLAPSWGGKTPLSPEPEDRMVISTVPDIFVTGHVHGHYVGNHKGTTMVHSSTWQDQTDYQRMLGFQPKPCILTVINLHTHATASIPFA